jgi:hypothetical protein
MWRTHGDAGRIGTWGGGRVAMRGDGRDGTSTAMMCDDELGYVSRASTPPPCSRTRAAYSTTSPATRRPSSTAKLVPRSHG